MTQKMVFSFKMILAAFIGGVTAVLTTPLFYFMILSVQSIFSDHMLSGNDVALGPGLAYFAIYYGLAGTFVYGIPVVLALKVFGKDSVTNISIAGAVGGLLIGILALKGLENPLVCFLCILVGFVCAWTGSIIYPSNKASKRTDGGAAA